MTVDTKNCWHISIIEIGTESCPSLTQRANDVRAINKTRAHNDEIEAIVYGLLIIEYDVTRESIDSSIAAKARRVSCHQVPRTPIGLTSSFSVCFPLSDVS